MADIYTQLFGDANTGNDTYTYATEYVVVALNLFQTCSQTGIQVTGDETTIIETEEGHDIISQEFGTLLLEVVGTDATEEINLIQNRTSVIDQL